MKKLLYLGIVLMLAYCGPNREELKSDIELLQEEIEMLKLEKEKKALEQSLEEYKRLEEERWLKSSTIKIGNLEVMTEDLGEMNWDEAKKACADLGDGWRLPTKDELNILYQNKDKIGGFASNYYWSSTEYDNDGAWIQSFSSGNQFVNFKFRLNYVRAVRNF